MAGAVRSLEREEQTMRIELKRGEYTAAVDYRGRELVSFRDGQGVEYIWQGDAKSWTGQNPNLFPIVGNLRDGTVRINGKDCEMARHGFARHSELDHGFSTRFEVRNPGGDDLLFCVGAHTGINCPLNAGERFEDYRLVFDEKEEVRPLIPTERGLLAAGRFGPDLGRKDGGRSVHMTFDGFPMIAFWTMPHAGAPYICLEPWHGCAAYEDESGDFIDKPHAVRLAPGGEKRLIYTVELR